MFLSLFLSCRFSLLLLPLSFPVHSPCLASNSFDLLSPTPLTRKNGNSRTAKPACFLKTSNRPLERDKLNQKWGPSIITFLGLLPSSRTRKREKRMGPAVVAKVLGGRHNTHHTKPPRPPLFVNGCFSIVHGIVKMGKMSGKFEMPRANH